MTPSADKLLFIAASAFTDAADRRAFLDLACTGDPALRELVEDLLELDRDAGGFFDFPPEVRAPEAPADEGGENGGIGARIGPYRLIDRLGSGGCGVVYLAEQQEPVRRRVALKIVRLGMDTGSVIARFNLEREALARMDHPNIARVLDAGATASGRPYFVMELVDGEKITTFCDRKRLGLRQRLELFLLVCEAIQHAHQKGVIHRDIKPSNVLVRDDNGRAIPKVIDFGIAKATAGGVEAEGTVTRSGQLVGTPAYMSPEQAEGGADIDTRSDIFSLGALLCELLAGSPPLAPDEFAGRGVEQIRALVRDGGARAPSVKLRAMDRGGLAEIARCRGVDPQRLPSLLAGDLDWIVMKAIEKDPQRRYGTANGLAMDVRRHLREEPVLARPPSRGYLLAKLVRRNRIVFASGTVALLGLLGGLGLSTWLFLRERDAREEQARLRAVAERARANEVRLSADARAADQVAQAAVLLRYNEIRAADALLAGVPVERVPRSLEAANAFRDIANWNLVAGRREAAARRFHLAAHALAGADLRDRENITIELLPAVTAVCLWGQPGQYEQLRGLMIRRFGDSNNAVVAEQILKAMLLEPIDPGTLRGLQPMAEVIRRSLEDTTGQSPHMLAWRLFSLALTAYRGGDLETAADFARRSLATATNSEPRTVSNRLLLAMIDLRGGRAAEAADALADARVAVEGWTLRPFQVVNPDGTLWYNEWAVKILLEEAEAMAAAAVD